MALVKAKKVELIESYKDALSQAKSVVYVSYKGLSVGKTESLRKELYKEGHHYGVVKKTLWNLATKNAAVKGEAPLVNGELAVIWGADLLAPARLAHGFAKENKGVFSILGGIWEGEFKDAKAMTAIATIPPREVLLSQLAFLLKSPLQRVAIAMSEVAKKRG